MIDTGHVKLPQTERVKLDVKASADSGILVIIIKNKDTREVVYQISGDEIEDSQSLVCDSGSYEIQIVANGYQEKHLSVNYQVAITN